MNKLFSKLGALLLGASLVVAGGVAVSSKKAGEAGASDAVGACCDMSAKIAATTGYSKEHTYGDYLIYGGQNNNNGWEYFKFGGKKGSGETEKLTEAYIKTTSAVNYDIKRVDVVTLSSTVNSTVTWEVQVAADASFTSVTDTSSTASIDPKTAGTYSAAPSSGTSWGTGKYYCVNFHVTNKTTTNGCFIVTKVNFIYESTTPRGEITINDVASPVLNVDSSINLSYTWTPASGSSATISSSSWTSSDSSVLSVSGNTITGVAPGVATVTLNATDSLDEEYSVVSSKFFVTNTYDFAVGDNVALCSPGVSKELSAINSGNYGEGADYSGTPNGTFLLAVESGSVSGSFSFVNSEKYLSWSSGNTLTTSDSKNENSSWYVVAYDDYMVIANASVNSREIWWNNGSTGMRFACYEGKTPTTSGFNSCSLIKIEEAPVRGTIQILNNFGTFARKGFNSELLYEFTPADGDSATITSHTWTSSNTDAVTINGDYCSGVGPGKAKITLNATDSNGQEYTVSTADFTVVDVVSGTYVKKTSVNVGDTVVIVCGDAATQMADIANKYGVFVYFDVNPAAICDFVLEAGTTEGSYALKHEDKYLNWVSSTDISFVDTKSDNSSWTIEFDEDGNATIACVALDGDSHRSIAWNNGSPRFAAYKSGQTAIQLYGPAATPVVYDAAAFAQDLISLTNDQCSVYDTGDYNFEEAQTIFESVWESLAGDDYFGKLSNAEVLVLEEASADATSTDVVEKAMYRYDLITAKYGLTNFISGRTPTLGRYVPAYESNVDSSSSVAIIIVVAVASMTLLGTTLIIRKRKHQ